MASSGRWNSICSQFCNQLDARIVVFRIKMVELVFRQNHGCSDVVLDLHFVGGIEIGTQFVNAVGAIRIVAHAQVIRCQLLIFELQFVAETGR